VCVRPDGAVPRDVDGDQPRVRGAERRGVQTSRAAAPTGQKWPPKNITWPRERVVSQEKFSSPGPELTPQK
jgi:hypothetical protein